MDTSVVLGSIEGLYRELFLPSLLSNRKVIESPKAGVLKKSNAQAIC